MVVQKSYMDFQFVWCLWAWDTFIHEIQNRKPKNSAQIKF